MISVFGGPEGFRARTGSGPTLKSTVFAFGGFPAMLFPCCGMDATGRPIYVG